VLEQCAKAGLIKGNTLVVDGTQIRARAATTSLEQQVVEYLRNWSDEPERGDDDDITPGPGSAKTRRKAGDPDFRGETFSNATHRSRTDPEARLYKKGRNQEAYPRYLGHYVIDKDSGVILGAAASQAWGRAETVVARSLLSELCDLPYLTDRPRVLLDRGYRDGEFLADLLDLGYLPFVRLKTSTPETIPTWVRETTRLDWLSNRRQMIRIAKARNTVRSLVNHVKVPFEAARVRIEHAFAEAKQWHGLNRARGYGLLNCHWQVLMTATVQNIKRLARGLRRKPKSSWPAISALQNIPTPAVQVSRRLSAVLSWNLYRHLGKTWVLV